MFVIDLRSDNPSPVELNVGHRVRLDLSERGGGIVTGIITAVEKDSGRVQVSGRDLPLEWVSHVEVIGQVDDLNAGPA